MHYGSVPNIPKRLAATILFASPSETRFIMDDDLGLWGASESQTDIGNHVRIFLRRTCGLCGKQFKVKAIQKWRNSAT
jgi:hypothetical protein